MLVIPAVADVKSNIFFVEHLIDSTVAIDNIVNAHPTLDILKDVKSILCRSFYIMNADEVKGEIFWTICAQVSTGGIIRQRFTIKLRVYNAVNRPRKLGLAVIYTPLRQRLVPSSVARRYNMWLHWLGG